MGTSKRFLISLLLLIVCSSNLVAAAKIPQAFITIADKKGVPAKYLYAVSMNESSTKLKSKKIKPWPWTLNVRGKSYFYPTRVKACQALKDFIHNKKVAIKRIDVGISQVNIGWNGIKFFDSYCDGFEPYKNLEVAATILKQCYQVHGNWLNAAGCYHYPKGGTPAKKYKNGILAKLNKIVNQKGKNNIDDNTVSKVNSKRTNALNNTAKQSLVWELPKDHLAKNTNELVWVNPLPTATNKLQILNTKYFFTN